MEESIPGGEDRARLLAELQQILGRAFRDPGLLDRALTHRSFVHESGAASARHNESLEFLGDSILNFVVSEELWRRHPEAEEGLLSKSRAFLVSAPSLHRVAQELGLGRYLRLSFGEEKTGGRRKRALLVDAFEAVIAALYLDGGMAAARAFVVERLEEMLSAIDLSGMQLDDFKSALQERLHLLRLPEAVYEVVEEVGPDHAKTFVVQLTIEGELAARGRGPTKKEAQQQAARLALRELEHRPASRED